MLKLCEDCSQIYDDADQSTICPHPEIKPKSLREQFDAGYALLGKTVRFHHMPPDSGHRVIALQSDGMIGLEGMTGQFAPHLFVIDEGPGEKAFDPMSCDLIDQIVRAAVDLFTNHLPPKKMQVRFQVYMIKRLSEELAKHYEVLKVIDPLRSSLADQEVTK